MKPASARARRRRFAAWARRYARDGLAYLLLGLATLVALFPVFWTLSTSIKQRADTFAIPPHFFDFVPTWKNYIAIFETAGFGRIYGPRDRRDP